VLPAITAAPPSITLVISCVGSTVTILSASCKSEELQVLLNGSTSQIYSAVPSFPVIHNLFFTNQTPFNPPLDV
jgi:GDP-D-mannose dehydratase